MSDSRANIGQLSLKPAKAADQYLEIENIVILPARFQPAVPSLCYARIASIAGRKPIVLFYPVKFSQDVNHDEFIIAKSLRYKLGFTADNPISIELMSDVQLKSSGANQIEFVIQKPIPYQSAQPIQIKHADLIALIKNRCRQQRFSLGQILYFPYDKTTMFEMRVDKINNHSFSSDDQHQLIDEQTYQITDETNVDVSVVSYIRNIFLTDKPEVKDESQLIRSSRIERIPDAPSIEIQSEELPLGGLPPTFTIDFKSKGIGGHHQELERLVREAFFTRALGQAGSASYGIRHTKGILLYGPPGTGKTLIAREIAKMFSHKKVKIVNGPELKNRYVGQSAENLRDIFAEAWLDWRRYGDRSDLHIIIFDEIDAICPKRGARSSGTGVDEDMVAQLLTLLDGVDTPQNFVVIGMSNRKDMIDEALLRSGRLEVHIEIKLPDEQGRLEILEIKTQIMREHDLLDESVNLSHWAAITKNYSGAELESLVVKATQFAIHGNLDFTDKKLSLRDMSVSGMEKVNEDHFKAAFAVIKPTFGFARPSQLGKVFVPYDEITENAMKQFVRYYHHDQINFAAFCLSGTAGVGKTALAWHLCELAQVSFVRHITPDRLLGLTLPQQIALIDEEVFQVSQVKKGVLILDDLEGILQSDPSGTVYNNQLRIKIDYVLRELNQSQHHCFAIVTTSDIEFIKKLNLFSLFNVNHLLRPIDWHQCSNRTISHLLNTLAGSFGYQFDMTDADAEYPMNGEMTMRELISLLHAFASKSDNSTQLKLSDFVALISAECRSEDKSSLSASQKSRDTAVTSLASSAEGFFLRRSK